jgi:hypothetical protein
MFQFLAYSLDEAGRENAERAPVSIKAAVRFLFEKFKVLDERPGSVTPRSVVLLVQSHPWIEDRAKCWCHDVIPL